MSLKKPKVKIIDVINSIRGEVVSQRPYSFVPKDAFWLDGSYWIGVQTDSWEQDEANYDSLVDGRIGGRGVKRRPSGSSTIIRQYVKGLSVTGATIENNDVEEIARISVGQQNLFFQSTDSISNADGGIYEYEIINTLTGNEIANGEVSRSGIGIGFDTFTSKINFPVGSYIARARIRTVPSYQLPPGYKINLAYVYKEDDVSYVYDPEYNIGRIPADINHNLIALRALIISQNKQKDKASWAQYLIGAGVANGEWSSLKIQVGAGAWTYNDDYVVSVGPVLKRINGSDPQDSAFINFDPLVRSITSSEYVHVDIKTKSGIIIAEKGSVIFAGNRSTRNGPVLAMWVMRKPVTSGDLPIIDLLAVTENPFNNTQESLLLEHSATRIRITEKGVLYLLSRAYFYQFYPGISDIKKRLVAFANTTGGQSLSLVGEKPYFVAERTVTTALDDAFYNKIVDVYGNNLTEDGTVFHGPNSIDSWMNKIWGIYQDKPSTDIKAKQYLAFNNNNRWAKKAKDFSLTDYIIDSGIEFNANDLNWQQVIAANNVLHLFGKRGPGLIEDDPTSTPVREHADGIMAVSNGKTFRVLNFDYRILKVVRIVSDEVDSRNKPVEKILAIAHKVNKNVLGKSIVDIDAYYILEIDSRGEPIDFNYNAFNDSFISKEITEINDLPERNTICGPMDVAFVIDDTGSMSGSLRSVANELNSILEKIEIVSAVGGIPDYRLSLITFKDDVSVRLNFSKNNRNLINGVIASLSASGGADGPEASDEAVNTAVNLLPALGRSQNIDFKPLPVLGNDPQWREEAAKIVILVTDAPAGGFVTDQGPESELMLSVAAQAKAKDILMACVQIGDGYGGGPEVLQQVAEITGGAYLQVEQNGIGTGDAIETIIANCGGRSRPLEMLNLNESPTFLSWEDKKWVQTNSLSSFNSILYRDVKPVEGKGYGFVAYSNKRKEIIDNPTAIFNASTNSFKIVDSAVSSAPSYLIPNLDEGHWMGSNTPPTEGIHLIKSNGSYVLCPDCLLPYHATEWASRGLLLRENVWEVVAIKPLDFIWNSTEKRFERTKVVVNKYGYVFNDLPNYLNYSTSGWATNSTTELRKINLLLGENSTHIYYSVPANESLPYNPTAWSRRRIIMGESSYSTSSGQIPVSLENPVLEKPFLVAGLPSPKFYFEIGPYFYNSEELHESLNAEELPKYLVYESKAWRAVTNLPTTGSYLFLETLSPRFVRYTLKSAQGGYPSWPYDPNENKYEVMQDVNGRWELNEYESTSNPPNLFYWNNNGICPQGLGGFYANKKDLIDVTPTTLPVTIFWNGTHWQAGTGDDELVRLITDERVWYCATTTLPYDPNTSENEGNGLLLTSDNKFIPTEVTPPYNYQECRVIRLSNLDVFRGNHILNTFAPCECNNAWECLGSIGEFKWKVIRLPRHGLPINVFELIDTNLDERLEKFDRNYSIAWYRPKGIRLSETNLTDFLSSFDTRVRFGKLEYLNTPYLTDIEVVVLYPTKLQKSKLPAIIRVI